MNKIEVVINDKYMRIQNDIYTDSVACLKLDGVYPNIGVEYQYLQWNDTIWGEDYYVDMNNYVQSFTDAQVNTLTNFVTNWTQPLGQEGNPTLEQAQGFKKSELQGKFNTDVQAISDALPHEMASWRKQEDEARAYVADNTVATPFLDVLVASRGLSETTLELANKVIANADAYEVAYAPLLGKYQSLVKKVDVATTVDEVNIIVW